ncbi:MAG: peptide deformylase [Candidatus Saccharibacteria bacterium]|nr:peptide deformylase [Candidatus Saccharibacteria bacterium]
MKKIASVKDIIVLPDPRLRQKSESVDIIDQEILDIIKNMKQAALDWEKTRPHEVSTALTAVQMGIMKRIVIVREDFGDKKNTNFQTLINPKIISTGGKIIRDFEGCLSVPDIYGKVARPDRVKIKAKNEKGETFFIKARGFLSRVLQHEYDHTEGIVFIDRIKNTNDFYRLDDEGELQRIDYDTNVKPTGFLRD